MSLKVTVAAGIDTAELHALSTRILVGRVEGADLHIDDASVSRRHAEAYLQGEAVFVRDLGSSNGTWINGQPIGEQPVMLAPGHTLHIGRVPVQIRWEGGRQTELAEPSAQLLNVMQQHAQRAPAPRLETGFTVGATATPHAADFPYRRQGSNGNGILLISLRKESYNNDEIMDGFIEFTALDNETVSSITIELVEIHKRGARNGHVWDRVLVKQGPWTCSKNDVVPLPFQLRVPSGTSVTGAEVQWELRGYVDIAWASDVDCKVPINMRNIDIEKVRDALGALDYRVASLEAEPLGQEYRGTFQPAPNKVKETGITDIHMKVQYLGTNLKVTMMVEKSSWFAFDKSTELVFDIARLRTATPGEVSALMMQTIDALMQR